MLATTVTSALSLLLALYGAQRAIAVGAVLRRRRQRRPVVAARVDDPRLPVVTVQLPLFNEPAVCERLVDAALALRWPHGKLEIQILDDSDDDTPLLIAARVARHSADGNSGVDVVHIRRPQRSGFKAGALQHGLARARGSVVAVFDADFVPAPDFLLRAIGPFLDDSAEQARVDMVQCRWGHLNRDASWLTRAQAVFLDAHFTLEHQARADGGRFFPFNGTAGLWRTQAIVDAGGWSADTLTEDLDLSLRAWAGGARFVYLDDVAVDAELPASTNAWKLQQHRWARGSMQTLRQRFTTVARAKRPLLARADALLRLSQNLTFLLLLLVCALLPAATLERADSADSVGRSLVDVTALGVGTVPVMLSFVVAGVLRGRGLLRALGDLPLALLFGAGLAVNNGRAVLEGLLSTTETAFARTPKAGARAPHATRGRSPPLTFLELFVGAVHVVTAVVLCVAGHPDLTPFLWLCGAGLVVTGARSLLEGAQARSDRPEAPQHPREQRGQHGAANDDDAGPQGFAPDPGLAEREVALVQQGQERGPQPQAALQGA